MEKITKLFLGLAGISAVSAGLAVGFMGTAEKAMEPVAATTPTTLSASSSTRRVWTRPNFDDWYANSAITAIRAWGGDAGTEAIYNTTSLKDSVNNLFYWYADVPTNVTGFQAVRLNPSDNTIWSYSANFAPENSTQVTFINGWSSNSYGVIGYPNMTANIAAAYVDGYCSCVDSDVNGFQAALLLKNNVYDNMSDTEKTTFASTPLVDFSYSEYSGNSNSYSGLTKNTSTTAGEKYTFIQNKYAAHTSPAAVVSSSADKASTLVLGGIAGVAVLAAGGYFFVCKKKAI